MGLLKDERYNIQTEVKIDPGYDPLPRGREFNPKQYEPAVMAFLQPHPSSWRVLDKHDYAELANVQNNGGNLKILTRRGGKWTETRNLQQARSGEGIAVFVRRPSAENKYGAGGSGQGELPSLAPKTYENIDPTVLIASPDNGATIDLDKAKTHVSTAFQEHTFTATDSVESVTRSLVKRSDPGAIYNYNPSFHPNKPPQEADTVRVAVGKSLLVKGTVSNSGSVFLTWKSSNGIAGSQSVAVEQGGKNVVTGWETKIDHIKPGDYTFIARAGKATHTSTAKLAGQHWVSVEYVDKDGKPVKPELDYLFTFEDGTKIKGRLKKGTDYIVGIPFLPFTLEIVPSDEKQNELDQIVADLEADLQQTVAQVSANSASLKAEWEQHPWYMKRIIADFYMVKGGALWAWDTVKSIWGLVSGVVTGAAKTAAWVAEFQMHKEKMYWHFISGNSDGVKTESKHLNKMLQEVGDDVADATEKGKTLYFLAHHERIGEVLGNFVKDYFEALSPQERYEFAARYGIDIILCFVGGAGGVVLGVKNAAKIGAYLNRAAVIIKELRFAKIIKGERVDRVVKAKTEKKLPRQSNYRTNADGSKNYIDPNAVEKLNNPNSKPTLTSDGKKVIPIGKTESEAITIRNKRNLDANGYLHKDGKSLKYDANGFPEFNSKFDTVIGDEHIGSGKDKLHFEAANKNLAKQLKDNPNLAKEIGLTDEQVNFFLKEPPEKMAPDGLTWHHHQDTGRMQLVDRVEHDTFKHTGGMSIWGGGY